MFEQLGPDRSNDDVVWFGASFWGNCVCISQQWLGRAKKLNDWLWPVKNAVFFHCLFHFNLNCLFGQDCLLGSQVINWSKKIGKLMRNPRRKIRQRSVEWFHRDVPAISSSLHISRICFSSGALHTFLFLHESLSSIFHFVNVNKTHLPATATRVSRP